MVNFNAAPNKKAKLVLETSAFKQSRSDLNVAFSTADRDTAILEFTVTQNNKPLLLGNDNIKSSIVFIHSNGLKMKAPLVITDGLNGKISYQIPNDILATPGTVTGQVYVARKSTTDTQAVVAERIFTFSIQESLAWEFDAETKLNYIIEFDELESQLKQRAYAIEEAMANAEDYVGQIEQAREKGLSDIEIAKGNAINEINTLATSKLTSIHNDGTDYLNNMVHIHGLIDDKITQFNSDVDAGGYIKDTDTTDWQKSKMTDDEGNSIYLDTIDFMNIENTITKSGLYYVADSTNGIDGENTNGLIRAHFRNVDNGVIEFSPTDSHNVYYLQKYSGIWDTFTKVVKTTPGFKAESEIGAQNKADIAFNNARSYVDNELNTRQKLLWSGNASAKDTTMTLTESYKNYTILIFEYFTQAGIKSYPTLIPTTTTIIPIQDFNLSNSDGGAARFYEAGIYMRTNTEFTITHNHTFVPETNTGISNSNPIEIRKIVGVK
ncbi:BppU family phage baseplate upper protein [Mammaliicoccus sciuri]|uniref:BppU family phage baseplate upper protein n=1 Tax=Mammaliicoccus sciuri TaxID=1296 RepID=UPI002884BF36|nr:BppU family phage baseplate upper protein [Mammaliicoccus sciuri]MDT0754028.1 BppU family phage baseplate upper protein [Mammaliicoccus sciuri]